MEKAGYQTMVSWKLGSDRKTKKKEFEVNPAWNSMYPRFQELRFTFAVTFASAQIEFGIDILPFIPFHPSFFL